jgi:hypothetical protein
MTAAIVVAVIAAMPPTIGVILTYLQARAARREASHERMCATTSSLSVLSTAIERLQGTADRVEAGIADLRERVGRLEGAAISPRGRRLGA